MILQEENDEEIAILPIENVKDINKFTDLHKDVVCRYMLRRIDTAITTGKTSINLFKYGRENKYFAITSNKFESQLTELLEYFVSTEKYELAARCRDTLQRYKNTISEGGTTSSL